jgi:SAM-dependent methyltransferase
VGQTLVEEAVVTEYDTIGAGYPLVRRPDSRIAAAIDRALGNSVTVVNVGAGAGSYESRTTIPIEPSETMIRQRPPNAATAIIGVAESLPLIDRAVDAATAFLTVHHWRDRERGLAEMRRVARGPVVILTYLMEDAIAHEARWVTRDYFPSIEALDHRIFPPREVFERALGAVHVEVVPVPRDCRDGFLHAYWARPTAYFDPNVRAGISGLALLAPRELERGLSMLRADLDSGAWSERYGALLERQEIDVGLRLVTAP